jgi:superfamily II DNA or RNA helicase
MKLRVTDDKNFLQVVDCTSNEIEQLEFSFTRKVDNWFIIKRKKPHWDGDIRYIDKYQRVPIGLWKEVENLCKKFHFPLEIEGIEHLYDKTHNDSDFKKWAISYFEESKITPRDYQLEGASRVLKFKNCTEEISTSGGKTLIAFMIFKYLHDVKKKPRMLYVVPNVNLVTQTEEKFYEYEDSCGKRPNWKSDCAFGGARKNDDKQFDIVFGTYQTLSKKGLEYFAQFDAVCIDETHHAKANSIKNILVKCYNAEYKFGLTGTLPEDGSNASFTIQAYLGPRVYTVHSADLIAAGNATPVKVVGIELDYLEPEIKKKLYDLRNVSGDEKDGAKLLNLEKDVARESRKRFNYIVSKIASVTKNSLVLFSDIKNDYGRTLYNWMKENTEKNVYYIDGGTKNENRDYYKKQMENQEDTIIIASIGVFSEGIDILNLHNIFVIESYKSQFIVRQVLGRGMRLMSGKEKVIVIDFSDNFEYGSGFQKVNYLMRHGNEREKLYKESRFPYKRFKIKL